MSRLTRWLAPTTTARAHCDIPCGIYDPARGPDRGPNRRPDGRAHRRHRTAPTSEAMNKFTRCVRRQGRPCREGQARGPGHLVRLLQAGAPREVSRSPRQGLEDPQARRQEQADGRCRAGRAARGLGQGIRRHLLGDQGVAGHPPSGAAEDARGGRHLSPRVCEGRGGSRSSRPAWSRPSSRATGFSSTRPSTRWPRRGSIVVFREPDSDDARGQACRGRPRRPRRVRRRLSRACRRRSLAARRRRRRP